MMFPFCFVLCVQSDPIICKHDLYHDKYLRAAPPVKLLEETCTPKWIEDDSVRKPIRVVFKLSDIPDAVKTVVTEILDNIKEFLYEFIRVKPYGRIIMEGETLCNECDLFIYVNGKKFDKSSSTIASAGAIGFDGSHDETCGRPVLGNITLNLNRVVSEPESFRSGERSYFMTLVHEVMHIMVFSTGLFSKWMSVRLGKGRGLVTINDTSHDMMRTFIETPKLKEWVRERFNVLDPKFRGEIGLELEDAGGDGTANSHPAERLYLSDLMQGKIYGPSYLSGIIEAALVDSGWYSVNHDLIEQLMYLDAEQSSVFDKLSEKTVLDPPQVGFPETTVCRSGSEYCFADYVYAGKCITKSRRSIEESTSSVTDHLSWYNPLKSSSLGSDEFLDYAKVVVPAYRNCRDQEYGLTRSSINDYIVEDHGETYGPNSVCAVSTLARSALHSTGKSGMCYAVRCRSDGRLAFVFDGKEYLCVETNQTLEIDGYSGVIWCPPAKVVCSSLPKTEVINIYNIIPDRGPRTGGNLVRIDGSDYDKYPDLEITIGSSIECRKIAQDNHSILCRIQTLKTQKAGVLTSVTLSSRSGGMKTSIPNMYLFSDFE